MTLLFQDGFDYDDRTVLADRGWEGSPFGFAHGAISTSGYPSYSIVVIENNDVINESWGAVDEFVAGFAHSNGSQPPLWDGAKIFSMRQAVGYHDCSCNPRIAYNWVGVGLDDVNTPYIWSKAPVFTSCPGPCPGCGDCMLFTGYAEEIDGIADESIPFNVWNYFELKFTHPSLHCQAELHMNGAPLIAAVPVNVLLGDVSNKANFTRLILSSGSLGSGQGIDDVYLADLLGATNNDFLGNVHITTTVPDADGYYQEWTPKTGIDHFAMVDDAVVDDEVTYNYTRDAGARDSYSMLPMPSDVTTVLSARVNAVMRSNSTDVRRAQLLTRQGGADYYSPSFSLSRDWQMYSWLLNQDPTNTDWTPAQVDADEFGVRAVDGGGTHDPADIRLSLVGVGGTG